MMDLIKQAANESRHELVLSGNDVAREIEENGLDDNLFKIQSLNFLEISKTKLSHVNDNLGLLHNLTNLVLRNNKLVYVPNTIGNLTKLKLLDLSFNCLSELTDSIANLSQLQTLNLGSNSLTVLPSLGKLSNLHVLDISHNNLECFPEGIDGVHTQFLLDLNLAGNKITEIPSNISTIPNLRMINISNNSLTEIPPKLGESGKLKDFRFEGNKIKDKRLVKLGLQCTTKAVLEYLLNQLPKEAKSKTSSKDNKHKKGHETEAIDDVEAVVGNLMTVLHFRDDGLCITATDRVINIRPYLICCIVKNINFERSKGLFKQFLSVQTQLHDTICDKRQLATIATHDLAAVKGPLVYDARCPADIEVKPLGRNKMTGEEYMNILWQEAEDFRKVKKRNTISGIHKYLELMRNKEKYAVLVDKDNVVISLPPLTNSDATKMSTGTRDLLLEVTGDSSLDLCKSIMDKLLQHILEMGLGDSDQSCSGDKSSLDNGHAKLTIEQVRIIDQRGQLRVVYPSRTDLRSDAFTTTRPAD